VPKGPARWRTAGKGGELNEISGNREKNGTKYLHEKREGSTRGGLRSGRLEGPGGASADVLRRIYLFSAGDNTA